MKKILKTHIANFWYYGMRTIVAFAIAFFVWHQDWVAAVSAAFILILMITPAFLRRWCDFYLPFELEVAITSFIFVTLFLGSLNDFYEKWPWWDTALHFQSGVLLATVGFVLIYVLNEGKVGKIALTPFFIAFFAACFSIATGVVWEIYEFAVDSIFGFNMQRTGLPDTMKDLILNTVGALIVGVVGYVWMKWRMKVPFTPKRLAGSRYDRSKKD
jgi:hypothetical protein